MYISYSNGLLKVRGTPGVGFDLTADGNNSIAPSGSSSCPFVVSSFLGLPSPFNCPRFVSFSTCCTQKCGMGD